MNETFVTSCVNNSNMLIDFGFRPLASTLGCANGIMKKDRMIVLQTDYVNVKNNFYT